MSVNGCVNRETQTVKDGGQSCAKLFTFSLLLKRSDFLFSNIYVITNLINGNQYVGQSIDVNKRWSAHKHWGKNRNDHTIALYNAMSKYGVDNFTVEIIEKDIDISLVNEREIFWIAELNTFKPNGYNLTLGGEGAKGCVMSEEQKENLSQKAKYRYNSLSDEEKKIYCSRLPRDSYDLDKMNEGYRRWFETASDEEKKNAYKKGSETKKLKEYDYYNFSFGKMNEEEKNNMYLTISKNNPRSMPILMLDTDGNYIMEFHSIGAASRYLNENYGVSLRGKANIRQVLDKDHLTEYGYKWKRK